MAKRSRLEGAEKVRDNLRRMAKNFPKEVGAAALAEMKIELREVNFETPILTGALRKSERVEGPEIEGRTIRIAIVAGGPDVPYALRVHEDLDAFHAVGGAKYIERPLNASAPFMAQRIVGRVKTRIDAMKNP